jgi:hypothetical protein
MNTTKTRPSLRLTSAAEAEIVPPPDPKAVRKTLWALHAALFGASATTRDIMYSDDQADRLEAVVRDLERITDEASNLLTALGR